jgi:hypothetical protein
MGQLSHRLPAEPILYLLLPVDYAVRHGGTADRQPIMVPMSASMLRPSPGRETSPPAVRSRRRSWRDPRLAVGLVLVCVSVLVGARVLASADDTVAVLAARDSLAAGQPVGADDLVEVRLRFGSEEDANRYLSAAEEIPAGAVLLRPVGPGELLPRTALSTDRGGLVELPLSVDPGRVPASVRPGSVVDVWVSPDGEGGGGSTDRLLSDVPVLSVSRAGGLGAAGFRQVVVGIPSEDAEVLDEVVGRLHGSLLVVRRPG